MQAGGSGPIEVLVVDDDPSKRYLALRHLRQAGIVCAEASTGQEGLERAREMPLLVLLDVALPDISGFDVCALLKRAPRTSSVLVVLLSAVLTETHHRVRGLSVGADGFITTPYAPEEFVANIRAFLRLARAERARTEALESERAARLELERTAAALAEERDRLRESEQRQRAVLEALSEGVLVYGHDGRVQLANASALRILGRRSVAELADFPPRDALREDGSVWPMGTRPWQEVLRTGQAQTSQLLGLPRPGGTQWLSLNSQPIVAPDGHTLVGAVSSFDDVTEQRRAAEERQTLASLVESSSDFIAFSSLEGELRYVNRAGRQLVGIDGEADLELRDVRALFPPDEARRVTEEVWPAVWRDGHWEGETLLRHLQSGRLIPVHRTVFLVRDAQSGRPLAQGTVARDVTEQKERERELQERAAFEQQLVGIVSHDLRNPITAIHLGMAALLRRTDLDEKMRRTLARVVGSSERAGRLIRDLLDFTQARVGGGIPVQRAPVELAPLVQQVVDELALAFPGRRVEVVDEGAGCGEWDGDRLVQLLSNLVRNALTYGRPDAPVQVRVGGDAAQVRLSVHNDGEPIPQEKLSTIFEPLQRVSSAGHDARSIGLGLFIVDQVVRAHGGAVQVASTVAEGTRFTVTLPRFASKGAALPDGDGQATV